MLHKFFIYKFYNSVRSRTWSEHTKFTWNVTSTSYLQILQFWMSEARRDRNQILLEKEENDSVFSKCFSDLKEYNWRLIITINKGMWTLNRAESFESTFGNVVVSRKWSNLLLNLIKKARFCGCFKNTISVYNALGGGYKRQLDSSQSNHHKVNYRVNGISFLIGVRNYLVNL